MEQTQSTQEHTDFQKNPLDIVVLSDNAVDIDSSQASVYGEWSFKENIMETPNTPSTPDEGLTGILYDLGLACSANASDALPPPSSLDSMPKIALIRRGQCFFSQKLLHAQMDGAIGAIVYDNVSFADDPLANYGMSIAPDTINITAFYVDMNIGLELYERLKNITQFNLDNTRNSGNSTENRPNLHLTRVTLYSGNTSGATSWQYALVVVGGVLILSILTSVALHFHIWRSRRGRSVQMEEQATIPMSDRNQATTTYRQVLEPFLLDIFPTRTVSRDQSSKNDIYSEPIGRSAISLTDLREIMVIDDSDYHLKPRAKSVCNEVLHDDKDISVFTTEDVDVDKRVDCVICLDGYSEGDVLRRLPCGHEYHRDCIDPWLTKRSASCPLCKRDLSLIHPPEESHIESPMVNYQRRRSASADDVTRLWERLSDDLDITIRQNPGLHEDQSGNTASRNDNNSH
ncbi:hypothetical protein INT44_002194 [Umbelopsis vinacea]|uniref:RING-type domain-containing protein n=1 Tax=Umbelopsis vinacea TaxID=44442 RepID=A0A8H7Q3V4_9FUNG|nr:hypothetical protein INT44_002194 [Umbelopsis vinacea]